MQTLLRINPNNPLTMANVARLEKLEKEREKMKKEKQLDPDMLKPLPRKNPFAFTAKQESGGSEKLEEAQEKDAKIQEKDAKFQEKDEKVEVAELPNDYFYNDEENNIESMDRVKFDQLVCEWEDRLFRQELLSPFHKELGCQEYFLGDYIMRNTSHRCESSGCVISPGEFYLNPVYKDKEYWRNLRILNMALICTASTVERNAVECSKPRKPTPWRGHVVEGANLLAKCSRSSPGPFPINVETWHRVKIISETSRGIYKVQLIDYGHILEVPFKDLRYNFEFIQKSLESQRIRCTVRYPNRDAPWIEEEGKLLARILHKIDSNPDRVLSVHFQKKFIVEGEPIWKVAIHLYDLKLKQITHFHVEREVYNRTKVQRFLTYKEREETETNTKVRFSYWPGEG